MFNEITDNIVHCFQFIIFYIIIVNRPRNGYETVTNIKVVSVDSFKQLEVANKVTMSQTKQHVYCKLGFRLHTKVSLYL